MLAQLHVLIFKRAFLLFKKATVRTKKIVFLMNQYNRGKALKIPQYNYNLL